MNEKLKRIHLYYLESRDEYNMEIEIGNKQRSVSFRMNNNQTRKVIEPLISTLCDACAMNANELKQECINALGVNSNENNA
jgi:hypothetical protein